MEREQDMLEGDSQYGTRERETLGEKTERERAGDPHREEERLHERSRQSAETFGSRSLAMTTQLLDRTPLEA